MKCTKCGIGTMTITEQKVNLNTVTHIDTTTNTWVCKVCGYTTKTTDRNLDIYENPYRNYG